MHSVSHMTVFCWQLAVCMCVVELHCVNLGHVVFLISSILLLTNLAGAGPGQI